MADLQKKSFVEICSMKLCSRDTRECSSETLNFNFNSRRGGGGGSQLGRNQIKGGGQVNSFSHFTWTHK